MTPHDVNTQDDLDSLPMLTPRQAYLAMYEFLKMEFDMAGDDKVIHLGGLLAEMEPETSGSTSDSGALATFANAIQAVFSDTYESPWRN